MDNIEQFKNDKNKPADLEEKLDNLTDQLLNAFEGKDDIIWENGKPDKFRKYLLLNYMQMDLIGMIQPFQMNVMHARS